MAGSKRIIVGTAGHIDHGKTSLVARLTGVDTDRLPEEKRRGITIVLGFAPLTLSNGTTVSVIDVPGHERFVKNMVAGAGGIDIALLVVAADEGVMPQTREHVEICELLGVRQGVVALTKVDRAGELLELAEEDVREELAGSVFENAPLVRCSSTTGEGIDELKETLTKMVTQLDARADLGPAYLPIDRVFNVKGFGTVVTGTLTQGTLRVGDGVEALPARAGHALPKSAKVRGLQVFGEKVESTGPGVRVAVDVQGGSLDNLTPGQSLTSRSSLVPTRRLTGQLRHLAVRDKDLKTGAKLMLHLGTSLVEAGVTLLDCDRLAPGETGLATFRLKEAIAARAGQRFIVRSYDAAGRAGRTAGGGLVLDPEPPRRRRLKDETKAVGQALHERWLTPDGESETAAVLALLQEAGPRGLTAPDLARRLALGENSLTKLASKASKAVNLGDRWAHESSIRSTEAEALRMIEEHHQEFPFRVGMSRQELESQFGKRAPASMIRRALKRLAQSKQLVEAEANYRLPSHKQQGADPAVRDKLLQQLEQGGLTPLTAPELGVSLKLPDKSLKELLAALTREGALIHIAPKIYYARSVFDDAAQKIVNFARTHDGVSTQQAKQVLDIPRKYLIPLLETLDKRGLTMRVGETRKAR